MVRFDVNIPLIGFGPGILGYSTKYVRGGSSKNLFNFALRGYNRIFGNKHRESVFVSNVVHAINSGFRLIDYSAAYGGERLIGSAIKKCKVPRKEIFLTARISNGAQKKKQVRDQFFQTLQNYGIGSVDLLMFHWPVTDVYLDTWREMIKLCHEGYARSLGVSNCHEHHLERLLKEGVVPIVNQIEVHPLFTQKSLLGYCLAKGIKVEAYTPIARFDDRLMRLPALKSIAKKYGKTPVQIVLRWHVQSGTIPIVRTLTKKHQEENLSIFDFEMTPEETAKIDGFNINSRLRYDPDNCDFSIL